MSKKTKTTTAPALARPADLTLDQHVDAFLTSYKNERTRESYSAQLRTYARWIAARHIPALDVTKEHVQAFADHLETEGRAPGTIAGTLGTLTQFYEHLIDAELCTKNPARKVPRPDVPAESTRQAPTLEQAMTMNDLAAIGPDPREHLLFALLFFNGLRVEEALSITLPALQNKNGRTLFQFIGKGAKPALVTLPEEPTLQALERVRAGMNDPTARLFPWSRHQANRLIQDLAERAGITDIHVTPHCLRHALITIAFDMGVPPHEIQAMARHSNNSTTWRYNRRKAEQATRASDGIAAKALNPFAQTA